MAKHSHGWWVGVPLLLKKQGQGGLDSFDRFFPNFFFLVLGINLTTSDKDKIGQTFVPLG